MADIKVKVVLPQYNSAPPKWVGQVLGDIERVVYANEEQLLRDALAEFSANISSVIRDAALYRFGQIRGQSILITSIEQGSIEITLLVVAGAYWVLEKALGESFKGAWKGSEWDKQLHDFFRLRIDHIPREIAHRIHAKYSLSDKPKPKQVEHKASSPLPKKPQWAAESVKVSKMQEGEYEIKIVAIDMAMSEFPMTYHELLPDKQANK